MFQINVVRKGKIETVMFQADSLASALLIARHLGAGTVVRVH